MQCDTDVLEFLDAYEKLLNGYNTNNGPAIIEDAVVLANTFGAEISDVSELEQLLRSFLKRRSLRNLNSGVFGILANVLSLTRTIVDGNLQTSRQSPTVGSSCPPGRDDVPGGSWTSFAGAIMATSTPSRFKTERPSPPPPFQDSTADSSVPVFGVSMSQQLLAPLGSHSVVNLHEVSHAENTPEFSDSTPSSTLKAAPHAKVMAIPKCKRVVPPGSAEVDPSRLDQPTASDDTAHDHGQHTDAGAVQSTVETSTNHLTTPAQRMSGEVSVEQPSRPADTTHAHGQHTSSVLQVTPGTSGANLGSAPGRKIAEKVRLYVHGEGCAAALIASSDLEYTVISDMGHEVTCRRVSDEVVDYLLIGDFMNRAPFVETVLIDSNGSSVLYPIAEETLRSIPSQQVFRLASTIQELANTKSREKAFQKFVRSLKRRIVRRKTDTNISFIVDAQLWANLFDYDSVTQPSIAYLFGILYIMAVNVLGLDKNCSIWFAFV